VRVILATMATVRPHWGKSRGLWFAGQRVQVWRGAVPDSERLGDHGVQTPRLL
jgi:hypothetical protein